MPNKIDRNASSSDRIRRTIQRLSQGAATGTIKVAPPITNNGSTVGLRIDPNGGLQTPSTGLGIKMSGPASTTGLTLGSTGLGTNAVVQAFPNTLVFRSAVGQSNFGIIAINRNDTSALGGIYASLAGTAQPGSGTSTIQMFGMQFNAIWPTGCSTVLGVTGNSTLVQLSNGSGDKVVPSTIGTSIGLTLVGDTVTTGSTTMAIGDAITITPLSGGQFNVQSTIGTFCVIDVTTSPNPCVFTNVYGYCLGTLNGTTNAYGLYVSSTAIGATSGDNYGLYVGSGANNFIAGNLKLGGTLTLPAQSSTTVFAGPSTGANAVPTFRKLSSTDIPALGILFAITADSNSVTNSSTETLFNSSTTFRANTLHVGQIIRLTGELVYQTSTGFNGLALRCLFNFGQASSTVLAATSNQTLLVNGGAASPYPFSMYFVVRSLGSTGTLQPGGLAYVPGASGNTFVLLGGTTITFNSTIDNIFGLTAQWSAANANNTVHAAIFNVESLN